MGFGLDLLRHLFCLAVIVQHMASASRYSGETLQSLAAVVGWVDGAVLGFFLISGFLFKRPSSVTGYMKKQAWRLLVPFLAFSLLYAVVLAVMGKQPLGSGLLDTATLRGTGMQLYFLPYLLVVGSVHAVIDRLVPALRIQVLSVLLSFAFLMCFWFPTSGSSGPDFRLLPLYAGAYWAGVLAQAFAVRGQCGVFMLSLMAVSLGVGMLDPRFDDVAIVAAIFGACFMLRAWLPHARLPGSGGVYLLHTPVVNFAISSVLSSIGVAQGWNIGLSVLLTYALCLAITRWVIDHLPAHRWLLLE